MNAKKIITLLLALVLAAGTVACGAKQAERNEDTDKEPQTAEEAAALYDELMAQENAIQAENTELWEKLFLSADKGMATMENGKNYGEFLLSTIEAAKEQFTDEEYELLCSIERLAPQVFAEEKHSPKKVCANVDLFSGLIYNMLGISEDLYTPLFAIARVPGWCAHRVEEVIFANRIIRPAYKYLGVRQKYKPIEER